MKVCGPQGWEFDLQWRPKGGEIDIWKPENVKFPVGCPAPPSWGKPLIGALVKDSVQFINFFWRTGFLRIFGVKIRNDKMHLNVCQLKSFLLACLSEFLSPFLFESRIVVDPPTAKANWFQYFFLTRALCRVLEKKALMKISSAWFKRH